MAEMKELQNLRHKGKQKKPKPWDDDPDLERCLDRWAAQKKFDPAWNPTGMLEVSSFSRMYPRRREKYLLKCWPRVKSALKEHGVSCELNLAERYMTVSTTKKTRDPYIIFKARDLLRLLSRSVPSRQALKILEDDMTYDVIDMRLFVRTSLVRSKEKYLIRRIRFLGHKSSTVKALETSTNCFIRVQGNTVAAMGSFSALRRLRRVVEICFRCGMRPLDVLRKMDAGEQHWSPDEFEDIDF